MNIIDLSGFKEAVPVIYLCNTNSFSRFLFTCSSLFPSNCGFCVLLVHQVVIHHLRNIDSLPLSRQAMRLIITVVFVNLVCIFGFNISGHFGEEFIFPYFFQRKLNSLLLNILGTCTDSLWLLFSVTLPQIIVN